MSYLVVFHHTHRDFSLAELASTLSLARLVGSTPDSGSGSGCGPGSAGCGSAGCGSRGGSSSSTGSQLRSLADDVSSTHYDCLDAASRLLASSGPQKRGVPYLVDRYAAHQLKARVPDALTPMGAAAPVYYVPFQSEQEAAQAAQRAMLLNTIVDVWGSGASVGEAINSATPHPDALKSHKTFRVDIISHGAQLSRKERMDTIERVVRDTRALDNLTVALSAPDVVVAVVVVDSLTMDLSKTNILPKEEKYMPKRARRRLERMRIASESAGDDSTSTPQEQRQHEEAPRVIHWFVGKVVAESRRNEQVNAVLPVSKRRYIANTSMNAEMACIMSNLGLVKPGSFVCDPYVGTASILLSVSLHGGHTMGFDIDGRVLRGSGKVWAPPEAYDSLSDKERACGKAKGYQESAADRERLARQLGELPLLDESSSGLKLAVSPWINFRDTGLRPPVGLCQGDATRLPFRGNARGLFDAIITDPPYGVRERSRKVEAKDVDRQKYGDNHSVSTSRCEVDEAFEHLLWNAAHLLRVGARLVCFLPVQREDYTPSTRPANVCLELLHDCEDVLQSKFARRLLVYVKRRDPTDEEWTTWLHYRDARARGAAIVQQEKERQQSR